MRHMTMEELAIVVGGYDSGGGFDTSAYTDYQTVASDTFLVTTTQEDLSANAATAQSAGWQIDIEINTNPRGVTVRATRRS